MFSLLLEIVEQGSLQEGKVQMETTRASVSQTALVRSRLRFDT